MAVVKGTNCGFVTAAPAADPAGANGPIDTVAMAFKDTTPAGSYKVTEIGWYCDNATEAAEFDVGIYSHDAGNDRPNALVGVSANNAKGTDAGWKKITSLNIALTGGTIYWVAIQLDNTATETNLNYNPGDKYNSKDGQTALPSSWGTSDGSASILVSVYALIVPVPSGGLGLGIGNPWIFMKETLDKGKKYFKKKGLYLPDDRLFKPEFAIVEEVK